MAPQYEENPSSHHGWMREDRLTDRQLMDWTLSNIPWFRIGRAMNTKCNSIILYVVDVEMANAVHCTTGTAAANGYNQEAQNNNASDTDITPIYGICSSAIVYTKMSLQSSLSVLMITCTADAKCLWCFLPWTHQNMSQVPTYTSEGGHNVMRTT